MMLSSMLLISGIYTNFCNFLCIKDITPLTMVFTEEDRVVIKFLHQNKGYSSRHLLKEFPLKNWQVEQTFEEN